MDCFKVLYLTCEEFNFCFVLGGWSDMVECDVFEVECMVLMSYVCFFLNFKVRLWSNIFVWFYLFCFYVVCVWCDLFGFELFWGFWRFVLLYLQRLFRVWLIVYRWSVVWVCCLCFVDYCCFVWILWSVSMYDS